MKGKHVNKRNEIEYQQILHHRTSHLYHQNITKIT
jgi:hypothetical protein